MITKKKYAMSTRVYFYFLLLYRPLTLYQINNYLGIRCRRMSFDLITYTNILSYNYNTQIINILEEYFCVLSVY